MSEKNANYATVADHVKNMMRAALEIERNKEAEIQAALAMETHTQIIGGRRFTYQLTPENRATIVEEIRREDDAKLQTIRDGVASDLDALNKQVTQEFYAVYPRPTDVERGEILSIVREYQSSEAPDKLQNFINERNHHIENETVMAISYIFAGKELGIGVDWDFTVSDSDVPMDGFVEPSPGSAAPSVVSIMRQDYIAKKKQEMTKNMQAKIPTDAAARLKYDTEQLIMKINPELKVAQENYDHVIEAKRVFDILTLLCRRAELAPTATSPNSSVNTDAMKMERLVITDKLVKLAANPNITVDDFLGE